MDEERDYYRKRSYVQENYVENEESKKRSLTVHRKQQDLISEYTVYRYLCPRRKAGLVIGRGGEIMKQLRADTGAKVLLEGAKQGCEQRIVTISSSSKETNPFCYKKDYACPAQDALFRVHEKIAIEEPFVCDEGDDIGANPVTARLLIPSDQARCIIGRRGDTINNMRKDSGAWISIWNDNRIPICADSTEELLQITGDVLVVREALFQISCLLREYPSRFHDQICHSIRDPTTRPCSSKEDINEFTLRLAGIWSNNKPGLFF